MPSRIAVVSTCISLIACGFFFAHVPAPPRLPLNDPKLTHLVVITDRPSEWATVAERDDIGWLVALDVGFDGKKFDTYVRHLRSCPANVLVISSISNAALPLLKKMPRLRALVVMDGAISDDGLGQLLQFPNLETVGFYGCNVTRDGLADIRRRMPKTRFELHNPRRAGFVFDPTGCLTPEFRMTYRRSSWR